MNEMHRNLKVDVVKGILAKTNLNCSGVDKNNEVNKGI